MKSLEEDRFDEIFIATGSVSIIPKMDMHIEYKVRFAKDVLENPKDVGKDVFILGGGSVGVEVAEYLNHLGKRITVIEMLDKICGDLGPLNRANVLEKVNRSAMNILLDTKILDLTNKGVHVLRDGKEEILDPPDTAVIALGAKPNPISLYGIDGKVHYIGDCKKVGNAMDAIHDAFNIAINL
jgi:pyruvate/2-oxoglutarate dehydrogenase complex dihydrolipoamide dehydrogenase (E3) component